MVKGKVSFNLYIRGVEQPQRLGGYPTFIVLKANKSCNLALQFLFYVVAFLFGYWSKLLNPVREHSK